MRLVKCAMIWIIVISIMVISGCSSPTTATPKPNPLHDISFEYSESDVLSDSEYSELEAIIDGVQPPDMPWMTYVHYASAREEVKSVCEVGLRGIPVLIDKFHILNAPEPPRDKAMFLHYSIAALLRIQQSTWAYCPEEYFLNILLEAKTKINDIIASDEDLTQKMSLLREYGVVSIPYVVDEIKKGNTEYEVFFVEIGLHLSPVEFADRIELPINYPSGNVLSPKVDSYEARRKRVRTEGSPENFDYKVWLKENEDDLKILFKYLDAYCAEYEANNK